MNKIINIYKDYYKREKLKLSLYVLLTFLCFTVMILTPIISAKIIDSAVYFKEMDDFVKCVVLGIILHIIFIAIIPYKHYLDFKIQTEATAFLREKIITKIPLLTHETHNKTTLGYLLQLIDSDLWNSQSLVISDFVELLNQLLYFIVIIIIVIKINFILFSILIGFTFPLMIVSKVLVPKIQKAYYEYIKKKDSFNNLTDEVYSGSLAIKMANAYILINKKIKDIVNEAKHSLMRFNYYQVIHNHFLTGSIMNTGRLFITIVGSIMLIKGEMTIGSVVLVTSYFGGLWNTLNYFMDFWKGFKINMVSVERIDSFLKLPQESEEGLFVNEFNVIKMKDIAYKIDNKSILKKVSFTINKGDKIIINGDNGSGKTTLIRLLLGLIQPSSGSLTYNKNDLSSLNVHSLRDKITYIPSESYVFSGSLKDNFISNENDYPFINTDIYKNISKAGNNLSSGEKKKLQLARGLHSHSEIYILDEPLNFVDEISKNEIINIIKEMFNKKTIIIISHDQSPFSFCEKKYFLEDGCLMKKNSV